jgi:AraC family transcriptional regulator
MDADRHFNGIQIARRTLSDDRRIAFPLTKTHAICVSLAPATHQALWMDGCIRDAGPTPSGSVRIIPAGSSGELQVQPSTTRHSLRFPFVQLAIAPGAIGAFGVHEPVRWRLPRAREADRWLENICRRLASITNDQSDAIGGKEAEHLAFAALAHLLNAYTPLHQESVRRGALAPWQARRVVDHIQANLDQDLSLASLSQHVCLSKFHFCRAFRASVGLSPHRYLLQRRLEQAQLLLQSTRRSVTDIALSVGYSDSSHLSRLLRREFGMTPQQCRNRSADMSA